MQITPVFDASVASAPAGFQTAVQAAITYLDNLVVNNVTLTIDFGWGEVNGQSLSSRSLGESLSNGSYFSYGQVAGALAAAATSADDRIAVATLPAVNPISGGRFFVTDAEAMALGLGGFGDSVAGYVGLNASDRFTFDPGNRSVPGAYDAIAILEHEITEVMGRASSLGVADGRNTFTPMDLFRYSGPGVRELAQGPGYFSVDGQTMLLPYNDPSNGGDGGDWSASVVGDAFGAGSAGTTGAISAADLKEMDLLGYTLASASATPPQLFGATPVPHALAVPLGAPIILTFNEAVLPGANGLIGIYNSTTGALYTLISPHDASQVVVSGDNVFISPTGGLPVGANVTVLIDPGAITDIIGAPYVGITDPNQLTFTDATADQTAASLIANVLRAGDVGGPYAALGAQVTGGLTDGSMSFAQAVTAVEQAANGTTSVAILAYQFFTGATPSAAGLDYLVSPTGPNPNNLNSAYYQGFNDANRYINFAVNLGKFGQGAAGFANQFARMSLGEATTDEYAAIFGSTPSAAKVDALLNSVVVSNGVAITRADYLALYGGDGASGVGTKAAMAGWLLAEAVDEGVGTYATAEAGYLADLAGGHAGFNIDLIGVYHGTPYAVG